jgi:hypothetical protein
MIYLYVKTHRQTGLKYLGKTSSADPFKYKGSGFVWTRHLKKHGYDVDTEILLETTDKTEITKWGEYYSALWNVVESDKWANLTAETGAGGLTSSAEHISKTWTPARRKQASITHRQTISTILTCPHCAKEGNLPNMKRYHFDNCEVVAGIRYRKCDQPRKLIDKTKKAKSWTITSPDNVEYAVTNLRQFCREHNLNSGSISDVAAGHRKHHKGWTAIVQRDDTYS